MEIVYAILLTGLTFCIGLFTLIVIPLVIVPILFGLSDRYTDTAAGLSEQLYELGRGKGKDA